MKILFLGFCIYVTLHIENVSAHPKVPKKTVTDLGGYTPISADDENVQQLALLSLSCIAQKSGSERPLGLIKVVSAKSQVVAGTNYKMTLLVCETDSTDNNDMDHQSCRSCDVTVWDQPWLNKTSVTDVACTNPSDLESFSDVAENVPEPQ